MKPLILVTGVQNGPLAKALLATGQFNVRILTSHADSEDAIALQLAGAEITEGNMTDIRSLRSAMKGCDGVFGVNNYREDFDNEFEYDKNLFDLVQQACIRHYRFGLLPG